MRSELKGAAAALLLTIFVALPNVAQGAQGQSSAPPPPPGGGSGRYFRLEYPASTDPEGLQTPVSYLLWIPDTATQLRGLIVHQHGAGTTASIEGSTGAYDLHWQALAKKWDCALWSSSYHVRNEAVDLTPGGSEHWFDPRRGSEKTFLKALDDFAVKSGHAELAKVPWVLWGHSGGGIWADVMTTLHPDRVVAVWLRSGSAAMFRPRLEFPQPKIPAGAYAVPTMCNPGAKEGGPYKGTLATFKEYRLKGAPIGFAPDPRTGHGCGDSRYLAIPYLDACMAMRLPDKGSKDQKLKPVDMGKDWLAKLVEKNPKDVAAVPAAEYKGNVNEAVWLPNEAVAKAWVEYVKTGAVNDTTPPPAPTDVKTIDLGDRGTEVTWIAEADFASGIRQFVVLRDGKELAKVPEKPVGKFGRPLFQSMTYHDTPSQPMPQMRYLDTSAKAGEEHAYSVITMNSVGLKSAPSDTGAPHKDPPKQGRASKGVELLRDVAIPVKGDAPISLYGGGAASRDDCLRRQAGDSFRWKGSGQITWNVQVDRAGDYEVALNHAAEPGAVGQYVQISSGSSRVEYTLAKTKGVFGDMSYEMTPIKGLLHLGAGGQSIALSIRDAPKAMALLQFRSLELVPVAAQAVIEVDRREARRARASTEWMAKAGYGLMFHWTSQSIGKDGTHKPYAQAVDDFDVKRFAEMVEATGAGYVILTIGHAESYCPAPLEAWEKHHPGKTTRRDLIAEIADALSAKRIKLMCYLNAASLTGYPKVGEEEFTRIMTEVVTEFGEHYKEKVAGYWFDCCYQAKEKYPGFSFREFFKSCKAGNPNRIVALNSWIYPNVSEWQEYWAGETASPVELPLNGTTKEHGPGAGLRYQALLIMEPYWVQERVDMPKPRFTARQLGDYISQCSAKGGAVTINLGIYQDGTVDPRAVDVLKEAHKRVIVALKSGKRITFVGQPPRRFRQAWQQPTKPVDDLKQPI